MNIDCLQAYWLALVQGLTEFLPISSSAHLILLPILFHLPDQGLAFDVAVHVGTLIAVAGYFHEDLKRIALGFLWGNERRLGWAILIGTFPVGFFGFIGHNIVETYLRSPLVIASTTLLFGILLGVADRLGRREQTLGALTLKEALLVGLAQAIALIPGTSRSGITLTAGLFLGFKREEAARFSFLLSIPVIMLAGSYEGLKLISHPQPVDWSLLLFGVVVSALSAYGCIAAFLTTLNRVGLWPFVVYRLFLAVVLFFFYLSS